MRYFIIGFMGSGKSKIGKQLSEKLNLRYIDLDEYIEESENRTILDIFNKSGEIYFRELEERYLKEIMKEKDIIVSTGGGTPTVHNLIDLMNEFGETIYLECCIDTLFERLHNNKDKRPMISQLSDKILRRYIKNKMKERKFFYNKAKYTICNDNSICVNEIVKVLR